MWEVTETLTELMALCHRRGIDTSVMLPYKAPNRRTEVLVEHLLLAIIFGKPVALSHNVHGMPYVSGIDCYISITHTHGLVCIATAHHPVGIDVERKGTRVLKVRSRFLSGDEQEFLAADDAEANLIAWTAKEALYKVVGNPDATMRDHLLLDPFKPSIVGMLKFTATGMGKKYVVKSLSWHAHVLTLAIEACHDCERNPQAKHKPNIIEL